ncbi:hypothetical protein [Xanthomonas arboricola]|uniref:hypothetical protein n=1 Tax=Xanthomonas arboricola TaxID=56448 RepID=UPI002018B46A|nr:hypothetical protein [Xanthomonas arboricola]UQQ17128.1 hypothetical protein KPG65_11220 [Xanthomonas arboricola pv. corylina]
MALELVEDLLKILCNLRCQRDTRHATGLVCGPWDALPARHALFQIATHIVPGDGLPGRHDAGITLLGGLAPHLQVTASAAKKKPGKTVMLFT